MSDRACSICGLTFIGKHDCIGGPVEVTWDDLLGAITPEIQAEFEASMKAIEESERQAALHSHKVWLR